MFNQPIEKLIRSSSTYFRSPRGVLNALQTKLASLLPVTEAGKIFSFVGIQEHCWGYFGCQISSGKLLIFYAKSLDKLGIIGRRRVKFAWWQISSNYNLISFNNQWEFGLDTGLKIIRKPATKWALQKCVAAIFVKDSPCWMLATEKFQS